MITTILPCDQCHVVDITAELPRNGIRTMRLCPRDYAQAIGGHVSLIRQEMKKALIGQAEQRVPKSFDNAMARA